MAIKALLFDLDGTLRDSREVIYSAMEHALQTYLGEAPSREEIKPHIHHHTKVHEVFASHIPGDEFLRTYATKLETLKDEMSLYEGAAALIQEVSKTYRLAIVSSATTAKEYLSTYGLEDYFEVYVGGDDTQEHKPHPEPVLKALELLDVKPDEVIMIGDMSADVEAAHAAGVERVIGITHGFNTKEDLLEAGASRTVDTLAEVTAAVQQEAGITFMDHKTVEDYILSFPGAKLSYPFGKDVAVYKTDDKMFALIEEGSDPIKLSLKCDPQLAEILREKYVTVMAGYHLNKKHWNTIILSGEISWEEVQGFIIHSHALVTEN